MRTTPSRRSTVAICVALFLFITTGFAFPTFTDTILPLLRGELDVSAAWLGGVSAPALEATINTDRDDYSPGQIVQISGSGWQPNETVRLEVDYKTDRIAVRTLEGEIPHGHDPWNVIADAAGKVSSQWLVEQDSAGRTLLLKADGLSSGFHAEKTFFDAASIDLEQCHNFDGGFVDCVKISSNTNYWGSGNANGSGNGLTANAKLTEGDNQNFRAIMQQVPPGDYTIAFELDLTKGGKVAYDRYSSPGRIPTATDPVGDTKAGPGVTPESRGVFPCSDTAGANAWCTAGTGVPFEIPDYGATLIPAPVGDPLFRADVLASQVADNPEYMFFYGGGALGTLTMNSSGYSFSGDTLGDSSVRFSFSIHKTSDANTPMVLAWGGHISKTQDYATSGHTTATTINGSPYHMRLKAFSALQGSPGNQDMQMAASAIVAPIGNITITKVTVGAAGGPFGFAVSPTPSPLPQTGTFSLTTTEPTRTASTNFANVPAGTIRFTENSLPSGWQLTNIQCTGDDNPTINIPMGYVDIDLDDGETVNCTFTNSANAKLKLVKTVTNDNGGTAVANDWDLVASGTGGFTETTPGAATATFRDVNINQLYTLSETGGPSGYTQGNFSCDGGTQGTNTITLSVGQQVTCTVNNNDNAPELHLRKIVTNDNGGTATVADFTLTANGAGANDISGTSPVDSGAGLLADTFALTETASMAAAGKYTASAWVCVGGTQNGSNITVGLGQSATCTITNDDIAPQLHLRKIVTNDNGGVATVADFTLTGNGAGANDISGISPVDSGAGLLADTFTLSETLSMAAAGKYTASAWVCVGGTQGDSTHITVGVGQSATCTITNNDIPPQLHLRKIVTNDNGGVATVADFTLTGNGAGANDISGISPVDSGAGLLADTFALSETASMAAAGKYTASAWVCVGGSQAGSNITVGVGQSATCTITNDDIPPQLHLRKIVTNDNGGVATVADFTLTGNGAGANDISGISPVDSGAGLLADTFALSETASMAAAGKYTASAWVCVGGSQAGSNITVGVGQSATCTITNDDIPPQLHLRKIVTNDNGGVATVADFTLTGNGAGANDISGISPVDSGAGLLADTFALSETASMAAAGKYTASAWVCVGGSQAGSNITVGVGQSATCTITNDDIPPQLHLRKIVTNDNGGVATVADFTLTGNGAGANDISGISPVDSGAGLLADTFALSETASMAAAGKYTASAWVCVGGSQAGSNITVGVGQSATCTITNDDIPPQLHLRKIVTNDNGGVATVADFTLTGDGAGANDISGISPVDSGAGLLADTFALSESASMAADGKYTASAWVCVGGTQGDSTHITVGVGQSATCTITNDDIAPQLHLRKIVVNDNGGTATLSNFVLTGNGTGANDISGTSPVDSGPGLLADTFALSETTVTGYTASAWSCVGGTQAGSNITVGVGQSATCTITNDDIAPRLHLRKVIINDNGGTATLANFTLFANGTGSNDLAGTSPVDSGAGLLADTWTLSESGPAGYAASSWICVGGVQLNPTQISVGIGGEATCTITNNDIQPQLLVRKFVINNNGGMATAGQFTMTVTPTSTPNPLPTPTQFAGSNAGTNVALNAGSVHVDEVMPVGPQAYAKSYPATFEFNGQTLTNDCSSTGNVTVGVGDMKTCIVVNDDLAQTLVTSSSLCTFDVDPSTTPRQFRLLFTPDVQSGGYYKLNATNPGQTYYNVFYAPVSPTATETITLTIPWPYVTKGATPIHIYGDDTSINTVDGQQCITPGTEVGHRQDQIVLGGADYDGFGDTKEVEVTFDWPAGETFVYINIHLDYGLKGTTPYAKGANDDAIDPATMLVKIPNGQCYTFEADNSQPLADDTVCSLNSFKKNPGVGGLNRSAGDSPIPGQTFDLRNSSGLIVAGPVTVDVDGWYFIPFKHTAKAANYTVTWRETGATKIVTLKSNGMAQADFLPPLP